MLQPYGAVTVGTVAGVVSCLGYKVLTGDGEARDPRHLRGEQPARRARPHGQGGGQGQGGAGDCGQEPGRGQEDGGSTR